MGLPRFGGQLRVVVFPDEVHSERSRVSAPLMGKWKRAALATGPDIAQSSRRLLSRPDLEGDRGLVAEARVPPVWIVRGKLWYIIPDKTVSASLRFPLKSLLDSHLSDIQESE